MIHSTLKKVVQKEMNLHKIQSQQGNAEIATTMNAATKIVTAQRNAPIIGIVQDGLIGGYLLTNEICLVNREIVMDCVSAADISFKHYNTILAHAYDFYPTYISKHSNNEYSLAKKIPGKILVSFLFPSKFKYTSKDDEKKGVIIENGCLTLESGPLCKRTIGSKEASIIHILWKNYSPKRALKFLTQTQLLTDTYVGLTGFSMGLADCILLDNTELKTLLSQLNGIIDALLHQQIDPALKEMQINAALNSATNNGTKLAIKYMNKAENNSVNIMRQSGAKGSVVNLTHIMSFIGQQNIQGKRIPASISDGTRTLSAFKKGDDSAAARGFIFNSYTNGLTPAEMYHHAEAGRDGIVAISCRTAESGYAHKCISRKMDDCVVSIDGSVRGSNGKIIQFLYGDMGLSPQHMCHNSPLTFPFFVNVRDVANKVNGLLPNHIARRELSPQEIDNVCLYIRAGYPSIITPVTDIATTCLRQALALSLKNIEVCEPLITRFGAEIIDALEKSKIQCGDAVGLIASSSIGEPTTQLSIPGHEKVIIMIDDKMRVVEIGYLVTELLEYDSESPDILIKIFEGSLGVYVPTLSYACGAEYVEWQPIKGVVKHTSTQNLVRITTRSGRTAITTQSHSHLTKRDGRIESIRADALQMGDAIPVCKYLKMPELYTHTFSGELQLDENSGWIVGVWLALGGPPTIDNCTYQLFTIYCDSIKDYSEYQHIWIETFCNGQIANGNIYSFIYQTVLSFRKGIIQGFFDVLGKIKYKKNLLFIDTTSKFIVYMATLLMSFGVFSVFEETGVCKIYEGYLHKYFSEIGSRVFETTRIVKRPLVLHDILDNVSVTQTVFNKALLGCKQWNSVNRSNTIDMSKLRFAKTKKEISRVLLENLGLAQESHIVWDPIASITIEKPSDEYVYDIMVESNHTFTLSNGIIVHNTLNTARLAGFGEKDVSLGIPRFCEILNATKSKHQKHPSCKIYINEMSPLQNLKESCHEYNKIFEHICVGTLLKKKGYKIFYTTAQPQTGPIKASVYEKFNPEWWMYFPFNEEVISLCFQTNVDISIQWIVKLCFDVDEMYRKKITTKYIGESIKEFMDGRCKVAYSPNAIGELYFVPDFEYICEQTKKDKKQSNIFADETQVINEGSIQFYLCRDFLRDCLEEITLSGIEGIKKIKLDANKPYFETKGSNLVQLLAHPYTNKTKTISNDLWEIYTTLGIEATRKYMYQEITRIISFDGTYVNPCHIQLLADCMTNSGAPTSTRRYGISRDVGPIAKMAFEQHIENATESALFTEKDNLTSSAATVMCGLVASSGTGVTNITTIDKLPVN